MISEGCGYVRRRQGLKPVDPASPAAHGIPVLPVHPPARKVAGGRRNSSAQTWDCFPWDSSIIALNTGRASAVSLNPNILFYSVT